MNSIAKQASQSARDLAIKMAKQMAREPVEVLKTASSQVTGEERSMSRENYSQPQNPDDQAKIVSHQNELQDRAKSSRQMEAFQRELDDIRKQRLFKDLQNKIAEGQDVPLEDYPELSMEQRQVLKAQMEAVKYQKQQAEYAQSQESFRMPTSKKGRRFGAGQKQEAEKQQTRVEKPVPPSG